MIQIFSIKFYIFSLFMTRLKQANGKEKKENVSYLERRQEKN